MCGICGEFRFEASDGGQATFERITRLMARRGPDSEGVWSDGAYCQLGFRRLAILDLSPAGDQPMLTPDGRYALVYNGELYNFAALRRELETVGVRFHSTGDTEVVLFALALWGERALERFNGMFALAFYDRQERTVLLARDHAGIKPLYYLLHRDGLFFASQYDQILAHPWREGLTISQDGLALYLRLAYIPAPYAILEQTFLLEPGCWLRVDAEGRREQGRYYEFPAYRQPDLADAAAYEAVEAAVADAVRRQMISDVPLGTFLSGGIDSPLIAAMMRAVGADPVRAYTIGAAGNPMDESNAAAAYARELGLQHTLEQFEPDQALDWLPRVVAACGEPFADYSIFPTMLVSNLARRDVTVALSGDGGDELFWGYVGRQSSILRGASAFRAPRWRRMAHWNARRMLGEGEAYEHLRLQGVGDWYRQKHVRIPEPKLRDIFPDVSGWPADHAAFDYGSWDANRTAQWLRWNEFTAHMTMVLLKVDRASMYHSLEVRVPLLDREVIDVATRVDWRSCLDPQTRQGKMPLRAALAAHVPRQTQRKLGFHVPMNEWLRGPLREVFADEVLSRQELLGLPFDRRAIEAFLTSHVSGAADHAAALWMLLSLALWSDHHLEAKKQQPVRVAA